MSDDILTFVPDEEIMQDAEDRVFGLKGRDLDIGIDCPCGKYLTLYSDSPKLCACGRIYRAEVLVFCNDDHPGDLEYWHERDYLGKEAMRRKYRHE